MLKGIPILIHVTRDPHNHMKNVLDRPGLLETGPIDQNRARPLPIIQTFYCASISTILV